MAQFAIWSTISCGSPDVLRQERAGGGLGKGERMTPSTARSAGRHPKCQVASGAGSPPDPLDTSAAYRCTGWPRRLCRSSYSEPSASCPYSIFGRSCLELGCMGQRHCHPAPSNVAEVLERQRAGPAGRGCTSLALVCYARVLSFWWPTNIRHAHSCEHESCLQCDVSSNNRMQRSDVHKILDRRPAAVGQRARVRCNLHSLVNSVSMALCGSAARE
jgi:hypothetical protein